MVRTLVPAATAMGAVLGMVWTAFRRLGAREDSRPPAGVAAILRPALRAPPPLRPLRYDRHRLVAGPAPPPRRSPPWYGRRQPARPRHRPAALRSRRRRRPRCHAGRRRPAPPARR